MNWKKFLKPDSTKMMIYAIIFLLISIIYFLQATSHPFSAYVYGFPLIFRDWNVGITDYFSYFNLCFDIIFDIVAPYIVSCFIVATYRKFKK